MPREPITRCCLCVERIREGTRRYCAHGSLLMRVYVAVEKKSRVRPDEFLCKRCRGSYDRWRRSMEGDFDELGERIENDSDDDNQNRILRFLSNYS
jgi:hypothetical protein